MILKPFSHDLKVSYRDFQQQSYFIVSDSGELKKVNVKGINSISSANDPGFKKIKDEDLIRRRFDENKLSGELVCDADMAEITDIISFRTARKENQTFPDLSFSSLGAVFSMEMFDLVCIEEIINGAHGKGMDVVKDSMIFGEKTDLFERFSRNLKRFREYLLKPSEFQILKEVKDDTEDILKEYTDNPYDHFLMGLVYNRPVSFQDLETAEKHMTVSYDISLKDSNAVLESRSLMMLAWLSYLKKDFSRSAELSLKCIERSQRTIPEAYYNLSKYYACSGDVKNSVKYLDEAVNSFDFLYTLKADMDGDYTEIKEKLIQYYIFMKNEDREYITKNLESMGISFVENSPSEIGDETAPADVSKQESQAENEEKTDVNAENAV